MTHRPGSWSRICAPAYAADPDEKLTESGFRLRWWVLDILANHFAFLRTLTARISASIIAGISIRSRREEKITIHIALSSAERTGFVAGLDAAREVATRVSLNSAELAESQQRQGDSGCHARQPHLLSSHVPPPHKTRSRELNVTEGGLFQSLMRISTMLSSVRSAKIKVPALAPGP